MKKLSGEAFILTMAVLWSLFPIFTILSYETLPPLFSASISTAFAALFFFVVMLIKGSYHELKSKTAWKYILLVTFFIGILFYSLVFVGIQQTTAGNASLALLTEVLFSFIILSIWGKEKITKHRMIGALFMVLGAAIVFFPKRSFVGIGDYILIAACLIPPFGNYYMKRARSYASAWTIMFVRSLLASIFLLMLSLLIEKTPDAGAVESSLIFVLVNGTLFLGFSKILWIEAIHRIPITKAISLANIGPLFTLFFAFFILGEVPQWTQIIAFFPMIVGVYLITSKDKH